MGGVNTKPSNFFKVIHPIDTGNRFLIYKVASRVFQIGELDYDINYVYTIINLLDRGFKFIPCFHFNNFHIFKSLILSIEKEMFNFNRQIFFKKVSLEKSIINEENIRIDLNSSNCSSLDTPCDSLDCVFSKLNNKKRRNFSHLAYLEDSLLFELELFKELENINIQVSFNITLDELKILKHFTKNKPFKVIQLDKNVGAGIISNDLYLSLANQIFDDANTYEKLGINPLDEAKEIIYDMLLALYNNNDMSKKLFELLKPNYGKLGVASVLAKIHKPIFDLRQIISYKDHITAPISIVIDGILFPFVKNFPSFFLVSQNFMQKAQNFKGTLNSTLVTADVVSLYSSIDLKERL